MAKEQLSEMENRLQNTTLENEQSLELEKLKELTEKYNTTKAGYLKEQQDNATKITVLSEANTALTDDLERFKKCTNDLENQLQNILKANS